MSHVLLLLKILQIFQQHHYVHTVFNIKVLLDT